MLILVYSHIFKHFERKILAWSSFSRSELYRNSISCHMAKSISDLFIELGFHFKIWSTASLQAIDYATTSENLKFCFCLKFDFRSIYAVLCLIVTLFLHSETSGPEFLKHLDFSWGLFCSSDIIFIQQQLSWGSVYGSCVLVQHLPGSLSRLPRGALEW